MTILNHATAAERERGLSWASDFPSAGAIVGDGGALTGTPTFDNGITLDGTTDLVTYNNVDGKFNSSTMSFVIKFTPNFATGDNVTRQFFDATNGSRFYVVKQNNANNNVLGILMGNALVAEVAEATYTGYWNEGDENILVITSANGDTSAWLNGTQILTDDNTGWTLKNPTEFYVGAQYGGINKFDGKINSIKVFKTQLTDQEALDISNNVTYEYINNTRGDYPLNMANHDPTNSRVLDVSGNDYHLAFGTGSAATTPTKNTQMQGYDFDGGDFFVISSGLGITDYPFTMSIVLSTTSPGLAAAIDLADSGAGASNCSIRINTDDTIQVSIRSGGGFNAAGNIIGNSGNVIHAVAVFASATSRSIYINGTLNATNTTNTSFFTPNRFTIGRFGDQTPSSFITGDMAKARVWNIALTPMQIKDLYIRDLKKFSEV